MRQHDQQRAYFWLGGSPCAGKSSIADWLVARYGLAYYQCDQIFGAHTGRATPETAPTLRQLGQFSWDEIWLEPVETLLDREIVAYREEFPMIQADLAELMQTTTAPILVEGAALLPDLVVDLLPEPHYGIWLVPTEAFQSEHYAGRDWARDIVNQTRAPDQAFQNWMDRDVAFARWVAARAEALGLRVLWVDGSQTIIDNAGLVAGHFQLMDISYEYKFRRDEP
jgi:hypothetical protein